jgi:ParB-like chromosome segregation protein Spo0J
MAKRKRLTPARPDYLDEAGAAPEAKGLYPMGIARHSPPIAQVAGDSSLKAAVEELADEIRTARSEGRLVQALPLDAVDEGHLVRDRISADDSEMAALLASLRARGQQTPIEVVELGRDSYGLISGWRRLTALRHLHGETGEDRFATVQALLRRPESASDAYLAMVEENEIRVGLSYYERARIAARAAEQGVYPGVTEALRGLFAAASRARRSKIGSFVALYQAFDDTLRFPSAVPERLGLSLAKALKEDPQAARRIVTTLRNTDPQSPAEEAAALQRALKPPREKPALTAGSETDRVETEMIGDIRLTGRATGDRLVLSGPGLTPDFHTRLRAWLYEQG